MDPLWMLVALASVIISKGYSVDPRGSYRYPAVWAAWSWWGACSRTCGNGVRMRTRRCLVWTGSTYVDTHLTACSGDNINYQLCNSRHCDDEKKDFRERQCAVYDDQLLFGGHSYKWKPHFGESVCELFCMAQGQNFYYSFGRVLDGTNCYNGTNDICVDGSCRAVGCDGNIGSEAKEDMCGVCGGKNRACAHVRRHYMTKFPEAKTDMRGYNEITKIPAGSMHIDIVDKSHNYLALMDDNKTFFLNGNYLIDSSMQIKLAGTTIHYERNFDHTERIYADGPTDNEIRVMLLYREMNDGVTYEYWFPSNGSAVNVSYVEDDLPLDGAYSDDVLSSSLNEIQDDNNDVLTTTSPSTTTKSGNEHSVNTSRKAHRTRSRQRAKTRARQRDKPARSKKHKKNKKLNEILRKAKKKKKNKKPSYCKPCPRISNRNKQFCSSTFVIHGMVNAIQWIGNVTRYDITILETYRNSISLLEREFIWSDNICKCPKLRLKFDYIIMGVANKFQSREHRLIINPSSYVRKYSLKHGEKLQYFRDKKKCKRKKIKTDNNYHLPPVF